jgi:hypothetical protein
MKGARERVGWGFQQVYLRALECFAPMARGDHTSRRASRAPARNKQLFKMDRCRPILRWDRRRGGADGFRVGVIPGWSTAQPGGVLDAGISYTYFNVSPYDLSPVGQPS